MPKIYKLLLLAVCLPFIGFAQNQTLRGDIKDKETKYPISNATVTLLMDGQLVNGLYSDEAGAFRFDEVAVGRYQIMFEYLGYETVTLSNIQVNTGKETVLVIEMQEGGMRTDEVVIKAAKSGDPLNEMAMGSSRSFTVEETDQYAGSRGDPSRMASNFAGVQGADDSRNDIVIRGNSPTGLLWRMEGIDIPNPNHFAIPGTTGGPISILNNKMLANSDFYTGAFPAEFGNGTAGVFDLRLRNGNNEKHEGSFQFGFLGTELSAEGPLSRAKKSSYLVTYRYSTLAIIGNMGISVGTSAIPKYQDLSFKLNFPTKNNGNFSVFGMGGLSTVNILISDQKKPEQNLYGENDRDQYFTSNIGVVGATYSKSFNPKTYMKVSVGASNQRVDAFHELVYRHVEDDLFKVDSLRQILGYRFGQTQYSANVVFNHKINNQLSIRTGIINNLYSLTYLDSLREMDTARANYFQFYRRWDTQGKFAYLGQLYFQAKYRLSDKLTLNAGLHSQYTTLGNSFSPIEPRASLRYDLNKKQNIAFSYGLHSQMQSPYLYFYFLNGENGNRTPHNLNMKVTRAHHLIATYNYQLGRATNLRAEAYYQSLYNIPVSMRPSSFSLINTGKGFSRFFPDTLVNTGIGYNYGAEFSVEKFFTNNYFLMLNTSLFQSRYQGSDGIWRNTDFNGNYIVNALFSKQFDFKDKKYSLNVGGKITTAGGGWYSPVDTVRSNYFRELIEVDSLRNTVRFKSYFRTDLRVSFLWNTKRLTHTFAVDVINLLNTRNILKLTYAPGDPNNPSNIRQEYQIGRLPIFYYRLDFHYKPKR